MSLTVGAIAAAIAGVSGTSKTHQGEHAAEKKASSLIVAYSYLQLKFRTNSVTEYDRVSHIVAQMPLPCERVVMPCELVCHASCYAMRSIISTLFERFDCLHI